MKLAFLACHLSFYPMMIWEVSAQHPMQLITWVGRQHVESRREQHWPVSVFHTFRKRADKASLVPGTRSLLSIGKCWVEAGSALQICDKTSLSEATSLFDHIDSARH